MRRLIASGELAVGAALPRVRGLAQQRAVNPNTVAKSYRTDDRRLARRARRPRPVRRDPARLRRLDEAVQRFTGDIIGLDYSSSTVLDRVAGELDLCLPKKST